MAADSGLLRLQRAAWQPICPEAPQLGDTVSPDLRQTALLVREARPSLEVRSLEAGRAITAFLPLPDGSKPLAPPAWSSDGERLAVLYETATPAGRQICAFIVRLSDQATQRAQLESLPASTSRLLPEDLPFLWAPDSATLLVVRGKFDSQHQTCFRRSRLKAVGCELVYHAVKGELESRVLWSPSGAYACYGAIADDAATITIYNIGKGTSAAVRHSVGSPAVCFAPDSSHLLCCGVRGHKAQFVDVQLATASPMVDIDTSGPWLNCVAWGSNGQVAISSNWGEGKLAMYTVIEGPSLQPLQTLTTSGLVDDPQYSPCGKYLSFLDQGPEMGIDPLSILMGGAITVAAARNEVVILHLPSMQPRSFGSRRGLDQHGPAAQLRPDHYMIPFKGAELVRWPARARLFWASQGLSLLSYGPGAGPAQVSGPHAALPLEALSVFPDTEMPCSRLDL